MIAEYATDSSAIISREEARALGLKRYFTGEACARGHIAERGTCNRRCYKCASETQKLLRDQNRGAVRQRDRERWARENAINPSKKRDYDAVKYLKNKDIILARCKKWRAEHRDHIRERAAKWYTKNRERMLKYYSKRYADNKDSARERFAVWLAKNREYDRQRRKKWRADNPEQRRVHCSQYYAKKRGADGSWTVDDIERIRKAQKDRCAYYRHCKTTLKGKGEIDHIVALAAGGSNWPSNLQLLCKCCNSSKQAHDQSNHLRQKYGMLL